MTTWHKVIVEPNYAVTPLYITKYLQGERNKLEANGVKILGDWQLISDPYLPGSSHRFYRIRVDIPSPSHMLL